MTNFTAGATGALIGAAIIVIIIAAINAQTVIR